MPWWATAILVAFTAGSSLLVLEYFRARHEVSETGLCYGPMFGSRGRIEWSELQSVRYAQVMKWFRLESRTGRVARLSAMLVGLPEFARILLDHAPDGVVDESTRPLLEATAKGQPPRVW